MDSVIQHLQIARAELMALIAAQEKKCEDAAKAGQDTSKLIPAPHRLLARIIDTAVERATQLK